MKTIAQFKISKDEDTYIAEGVDLAIVTQANDLDDLMSNIKEAVSLHLEGENIEDFDFSQKPSILVNFELPQYA
jgi:predicted RNase H-like HicB family nuclease